MNSLKDNINVEEGSFMYSLHESECFNCLLYKGFCVDTHRALFNKLQNNDVDLTLISELVNTHSYIQRSIIFSLSSLEDELEFIFIDGSKGKFNDVINHYDDINDFIDMVSILIKSYIAKHMVSDSFVEDTLEEIVINKSK